MLDIRHYLSSVCLTWRNLLQVSFSTTAIYHSYKTLVIIVVSSCVDIIWMHTAGYLVAISVLLSQIDLTIRQSRWSRWHILVQYYVAITIIYSALFIIGSYLSPTILASLIWLGLIMGATSYLSISKQELYAACVLTNFICISSLIVNFPPQLWYITLASGVIVTIIQIIFFTHYCRNRGLYLWKEYWHQLSVIYQLVFAFSRNELKLHTALSNSCAEVKHYRNSKNYVSLLTIWKITLSLAALRYRLEDPSLLLANHQLFKNINFILQDVIKDIQHSGSAAAHNLNKLLIKIDELESCYYNLLAPASTEPTVIFLLITDLRNLATQLSTIKFLPEYTPQLACSVSKVNQGIPKSLMWQNRVRLILITCSSFVLEKYLAFLPVLTTLVTMMLNETRYGISLTNIMLRGVSYLVICCGYVLLSPWLGVKFILLLTGISIIAYQAKTYFQYCTKTSAENFLMLIFCLLVCCIGNINPGPYSTFTAIAIGVIFSGLATLFYPKQEDIAFNNQLIKLCRELEYGLTKESNIANLEQFLDILWLSENQYFPSWIFNLGYNPALQHGQKNFIVKLWYVVEIITIDAIEKLHHDITPELIGLSSNCYLILNDLCLELIGLLQETNNTDFIAEFNKKLDNLEEISMGNDFNLDLLSLSYADIMLLQYNRRLKDLHKQLYILLASI